MAVKKKTGKTAASKPSKKTAAKTAVAKKKVGKPVPKARASKAKRAGGKPGAGKAAAKRAPVAGPDKKRDEQTSGLQEIRKTLLKQREGIVKEAKAEIGKYMSGENRQLVDTALDEGDWAVVDISEDINLRRLGSHRRALHDIDEVLRKMREGTYGICEECGEEISAKRLKVLPTASLCLKCQGNKEQLEAIEQEEGL